jgi:hypothetical protein
MSKLITKLTIYDVANNEQMDAIKIGGTAIGSPGRNAKISVVANAVRVIATFIAAAVHKTTTCNGTVSGKTKYNNRPNADPEHIKGKIYPVSIVQCSAVQCSAVQVQQRGGERVRGRETHTFMQ